jgi:hypothetical protein
LGDSQAQLNNRRTDARANVESACLATERNLNDSFRDITNIKEIQYLHWVLELRCATLADFSTKVRNQSRLVLTRTINVEEPTPREFDVCLREDR